MPPKAKAKPKPQLRKTAAAAAAAAAAADSEALLAPKEEPQAEETVAPAPQPPPPSQPTSYQSASLFLEDHSDTDSDAPAQAQPPPLPETELPAVPTTIPEDSEDDDDAAFSDQDDDPVVQSYDIVVNDTFEEMMYLFQYPVRSKTQPYTLHEGFAPVEARMKVETGVIELDIPINVERNYDEQKGILYGEALHKSRVQRSLRAGVAIDGAGEGGSSSSDRRKRRRTGDGDDGEDDSGIPTPEHLMDFEEAKRKNRILNRQTLGAKIQQNDANYFVGLFEDDKLHFTRLKGNMQLRPQFHHIDIMTEQERASQKAMRDMNNPNPTKPVEARAVNLSVKAASGDNRTLTAAEQLSKDIRLEEDEIWREIEWVDQDDDEAWQMFANVHKQQPVPLNNVLTKAEYFKWCSAPVGSSDGADDGRGHRHTRSGYPMAKNLRAKIPESDSLFIYDINESATGRFVEEANGPGPRITIVKSLQDVARNSETVVTMLPQPKHVKAVYDDFMAAGMGNPPSRLFIDCSTIDVKTSLDVGAAVRALGHEFVDAPVSGGVVGASAATLTFMLGAPDHIVSRVQPILERMGKRVVHMGKPGTGIVGKLANNYLLAISNLATAEAMNFGIKLGLEPKTLASLINCSTGRCWPSEVNNPVPGVVETAPSSRGYQGGFGVSLMAKDLKLAIAAAELADAKLVLADSARKVYDEAEIDYRAEILHAMAADAPESRLSISYVDGRYLIYDVNAVANLRSTWHMCGTLFGTLPQAQQQNVFHGLPMELMPEEAALLVEKGAAVIVDDTLAHSDAVQALDEADKAAILAVRTQQQDQLALANLEESKKRKEIAIENAKASGKWKTKPAKPAPAEASTAAAEGESSLFAMADEPTGEHAGADDAASTTAAAPDESSHRQYIIPMATTPIGAYSLQVPRESSHVPNPPTSRYSVYRHLHSLGYYMSPGLRFGCEFVAYPGDPLRFHSHFLVKTAGWDEEVGILDLVGGGRLGTGVKKAWMMGGQEEEGEDGKEGDVRVFSVEWGGFG
ncbi:hypothetical protein Dda_5877 [Drechslerella dactyloides]|uniref:tRNA-intron endonuclease SEN34 n=1 Tax=Drechslerella dactyloides TaxID=74499 RepID=A0AAD6NI33_DREDA|nr:hypothetical protein Dda_5877 [Drechslerella dactyloides]